MKPKTTECNRIFYWTRLDAKRMARVHIAKTLPAEHPWVFQCRDCMGWHFAPKVDADRLAYGRVYAAFSGRERA